MKKILILIISLSIGLHASTGADLSNKLNLSPSVKAKSQWKKVFTRPHKMKRYGIIKLSYSEQKVLLDYLIKHAADSDSPTLPGL